ncbi:MAG: ABC transporter permease [Lachnospiraceae bacterium]|nr:ABC transporter permease [Lachnospiraceae bacterium]
MKALRELYDYREMISGLVRRDLRGRYKGSVLGFLWTFINPLLQLLVYTMVFSVIMKNGIEKYYIFLFVALVPWMFFSTSIAGGSTSVLHSESMVKKIYFPREVLPISYVTSSFVNMILCLLVVFAVLIISGFGVSLKALLFLPIVMIVEYLLALGFTLMSSALTVYFRDLAYILNIVTMAWQYLTPVIYSVDQVPDEFKWVMQWNPMTSVIVAYRDILYYKQVPHMSTLIMATVLGIFFVVIGYIVFRALQKGFAEEM